MILCYKTILICAHSQSVCMQHTHTNIVRALCFFRLWIFFLFHRRSAEFRVNLNLLLASVYACGTCKQRERIILCGSTMFYVLFCPLIQFVGVFMCMCFSTVIFRMFHNSRHNEHPVRFDWYSLCSVYNWSCQPKWRHKFVHYIPQIIATNS